MNKHEMFEQFLETFLRHALDKYIHQCTQLVFSNLMSKSATKCIIRVLIDRNAFFKVQKNMLPKNVRLPLT